MNGRPLWMGNVFFTQVPLATRSAFMEEVVTEYRVLFVLDIVATHIRASAVSRYGCCPNGSRSDLAPELKILKCFDYFVGKTV